MNWFKNLSATPRLILSSGFMIVLCLVIGVLATFKVADANKSMAAIYQKHMAGTINIYNIESARISMGRLNRDAMLTRFISVVFQLRDHLAIALNVEHPLTNSELVVSPAMA